MNSHLVKFNLLLNCIKVCNFISAHDQTRKTQTQNQSAYLAAKQLERNIAFVFYKLSRTCDFWLSNDAIFTCCQVNISAWVLKPLLYLLVGIYSGPSQAFKMDFIINSYGFKLMLLIIFGKSLIVDVWRGPEYASDLF